jgi:hypothetical protein
MNTTTLDIIVKDMATPNTGLSKDTSAIGIAFNIDKNIRRLPK